MPPGRHGFLGVLPRPGASRLPVRCPSVPRSSNPRPLRDSNQPALLTRLASPSVSIRLALRHFPHDSSVQVVRLSPLRAAGCARTVHLYFPQGSSGSHYMSRYSGRFRSIPSEWLSYDFHPAVRNPLPSPSAASQPSRSLGTRILL
jgi:hypothetical protein